jgi:hypothetical protein
MIRLSFFLVPILYVAGVSISLAYDLFQFWTVGGGDDFAFLESLEYASYWPLRAYWRLV